METFVGWRFFLLFLIFSTPLVKECVTTDDVVRQDGDVMLAALFEISEAADGGTCGELDLTGVQNAFALQWFIDGLNNNNYIPGHKIGLEIRRLCHSPERARSEAFKLIEKYTNSSQAQLFGVIGPTTTSSAVAVAELYKSLPREKRIPLISGSATGKQLGDFDDFFRVVPNDDLQVEVIIELLIKLKWNYVALVYTDDEYGRVAAAALLKKAKNNNICVPLSVSFSKEGTSKIMRSLRGSEQTGQITGVVFFGHKLDAQYFLSELNKDATFVKVIFSESFGLQSSKGPVPVNGSVVVTPPYREVKGFREAWNNLWKNCNSPPENVTNNLWLKKLHEGHSSNCSRLLLKEEDKLLFTWYHVQAAAVYAAVLQRLHLGVDRVQVQNYTQTLNALKSHQWDLTAGFGNVSFSRNGEVKGESSQEPTYEVHNITQCRDEGYRCFEKIGNYTDNTLTINENRSGNLPKAQCEKDCLEQCVPRSLGDFSMVIQGHFYVVAVVPVHTNDENNAFQCGAARGSLGADFVEAIQYALARVNEAGSPWKKAVKGKKLGAIILDSCFSELVIKHKLLRLHLGEILTPHGLWMNETYVKENVVKNIVGYIGGFFSDISIAMSGVLTELNSDRRAYIHLSPTSVSDELSNRNRHPYFMRLTKSANSEAKAILELLQRLSATYVQIIYNEKDAYSKGFLELIRGHSLRYGVCIAQQVNISKVNEERQISYVREEIGNKRSARIVLVILQLEEITKLVRSLAQLENNGGLSQKDNFIFMGTEAWARKTDIIEGRQRLTGSITIAEEIALDSNFTDYFKNVDPLASNNFWLRDYWEERRNCSLDLSFRRRERACDDSDRGTYTQDHWIPYYIQAVFAFASGVGKALTKCDINNPFSDCTILSSRQMVDEMKQVELDLFGKGKAKVFDDNGDGKNSYKFMQAFWNSTTGDMQYRQIGDWTDHLSLSYDVSDLTEELPGNIEPRNYATACPNSKQCGKCPVPPSSQKSTQDQSQLPFIPAVVTIAVLGLLLVILIIVTVVAVRRYRSSIKYIAEQSSNHELRFENEGLSSASSMTLSNAPTLSHVPVQEMYCRGSGPSGVAFQSQMYHHQRADSADYATVVEAENALERPVPCRVKATDNDYLTVLGTSKTERKMHFV